jgi:Tol biopolymer transport system component
MTRHAVAVTSFPTGRWSGSRPRRARLAILAAACAWVCLTLAASAPRADAAFPGRNGAIAYAQTPDKVLIVRPDGTGQRVLLDGAGQHPSWSPNGRELAFDFFCGGQCGWGTASAVVPTSGPIQAFGERWIDGEDPFDDVPDPPLPPSAAAWTHPGWSPDGSRLVVAGPKGLRIVTRDGYHRLVTRYFGTAHIEPVWSPDGRMIAFSRCRETIAPGDGTVKYRGCAIHVVVPPTRSPIGYGVVQITPNDQNAHDPDWSPDGTRIAYEVGEYRDTGLGIWSVRPDGTDRRRIFPWGYTPAFSPDGTRIAIGSQAGIWTIRSDGTDLRRVTSGTTDQSPDWQALR